MKTKFGNIDEILALLPALPDQLTGIQETLIANLIMLSEIPSPTFEEQARVKLLLQRMVECGLINVSTDEAGNGVGIIPGKNPKKNILLVAHADSVYSSKVDHALSVLADEIVGPGVADNSLGMAVLATLPTILDLLDIQLDANLILLPFGTDATHAQDDFSPEEQAALEATRRRVPRCSSDRLGYSALDVSPNHKYTDLLGHC